MSGNVKRLLLCVFISATAWSAQSAPEQRQTTLRATTDLVVVDITVTDSHQRPVHGLSAPDFTVLEGGQPQTIKFFEEHAAGLAASAPLPPASPFGPESFTNNAPALPDGPLNILLFDKLNTPLENQSQVRDQVMKYLEEAPADGRTAIFTLTMELRMLQGFGADSKILRAAVEADEKTLAAMPHAADPVSGEQITNPVTGQQGENNPGTQNAADFIAGYGGAQTFAFLRQFEQNTLQVQAQDQERYTLQALGLLARYLSNFPGRKNLIWFSGSFPISILPDPHVKNLSTVFADSEIESRETIDLLTRSQVAVYPIEARGMMSEPGLEASTSGAGASLPGILANYHREFADAIAAEQGTMNQMATNTGGEAFKNTNGLKEAVEKAIDAGSNYYTFAYSPTNRDWNGNYRKIEVKVDRPKLELSYRRGYYADDPSKPVRHEEQGGGRNAPPTYDPIRAAMLQGAPGGTQVIFVADVRPSTADVENSPARGNHLGQKVAGPFHRYTVKFIVSPSQVDCGATPDGVHHCILEYRSYVYDAHGALINAEANGVRADIPATNFARMIDHHGTIDYMQQISVPVQGEFVLRVGVRDVATDRLGALELPIAAVARLEPFDASGVPPPPK